MSLHRSGAQQSELVEVLVLELSSYPPFGVDMPRPVSDSGISSVLTVAEFDIRRSRELPWIGDGAGMEGNVTMDT